MISSLLRNVVSRSHLFFIILAMSSVESYSQPYLSSISTDTSFLHNSEEWSELDVEINSWWMMKDEEGFLWFNSSEGLCRFDGSAFYYYRHDPSVSSSIPNGFITALGYINRNKAYVGFRELGLLEYDLVSEQVLRRYEPSDANGNSISSAFVSSLLVDGEEVLWVITDDHVLQRLDSVSHEFHHYEIPIPEEYISEGGGPSPGRILEDVSDTNILWIGSRFGIYLFDKNTEVFTLYPIDKYVRSYWYQFATPLYQTDDRLIWFGHFRNEGVKVFDPVNESWIARMPTTSVSSSFVYDIKPYGDSLLLASVRPDHLMTMERYNPGSYQIIEGSEKIAKFSCLGIDDQLNVYSTSPTAKLTKLSRRWSKFPFVDLLELYDGKNVPWCMTYDSTLSYYYISPRYGNNFLITDTEFGLIKKVELNEVKDDNLIVNEMISKDGLVYILTNKGVFIYSNDSDQVLKMQLDHELSERSFENGVFHLGVLWMGHGNKIVKFDPSDLNTEIYEVPGSETLQQRINDLAYIGNNQLLISTSAGIHLFGLRSEEFFKIEIKDSDLDLGNINQANSILRDQERKCIWVSTKTEGLLELSRVDSTVFSIRSHWNPLSGLTNVHHSANLIGSQIWTSTPSGFTIFDPSREDFISFQKTDGVLRGLRKGVIYQGYSGVSYAPYSSGFYRIDPSEIKTEEISPFLISMQVNGAQVQENNFQFRHNENNFRFEIGAKNFGVAGGTYYRYKLVGYDEEWNFLDRNNSVTVANLPAGKYEMQFDARSLHTFWNKDPESIAFSIKKHPLLTWWFKVFWLLLACGLLFLFYKWTQRRRTEKQRVLSLEKQKIESELKALKAQMNPHFLFNTLNSINWYIIKEKSAEASKYLTKFSKLMRLILENSKHDRITLAKELNALELYTSLEQVRCDGHFTFEIDVEDEIKSNAVLLPPLIFQPFFENAIWHGLIHKPERGHLLLHIAQHGNHMKCIIEDNGIGREAAQKIKEKTKQHGKSSGIEITRKRLMGLKGVTGDPLLIIDLKKDPNGKSSGTRIEILIPLL